MRLDFLKVFHSNVSIRPFPTLAVFLSMAFPEHDEGMRGMPIIALFHTVALVQAILCE